VAAVGCEEGVVEKWGEGLETALGLVSASERGGGVRLRLR